MSLVEICLWEGGGCEGGEAGGCDEVMAGRKWPAHTSSGFRGHLPSHLGWSHAQ